MGTVAFDMSAFKYTTYYTVHEVKVRARWGIAYTSSEYFVTLVNLNEQLREICPKGLKLHS